MNIEVVQYNDEYLPELTIFCNRCKELGWKNNESIEAMKLNDPNIQFWLIFINGQVASVAGAQELFAKDADSIVQDKDFRLFFRAATLPEYYNVMPFNRYMGHNLYVQQLAQPQRRWCFKRGAKRLFLTANTKNNGSPHMDKIAKVTRLNEIKVCKKRGIPPMWDELGTCMLFYTEQVMFKLIEENATWWINKGGLLKNGHC
jgi:hypothetical protein